MAEYQVPQFIEHEAKIVGPLTFRQFVYVGGAGAINLFLFFWLGGRSFLVFLVLAALVGGLGGALAFLKVQGRPFGSAILSMFGFFLKPRIYVWKKSDKKVPIIPSRPAPLRPEEAQAEREEEPEKTPLRFAERSRLKRLAWQVDTVREQGQQEQPPE